MWASLKKGALLQTSQPQKTKNQDQGKKKPWRFGKKPGGLSTASKRTKTRCRKDIKTKMDH